MKSSSENQERQRSPASTGDTLRQSPRLPNSYHYNGSASGSANGSKLPQSDSTLKENVKENGERSAPASWWSKSSRTSSDSGTEADDEMNTGVLRGLPAPPIHPRKGLRLNKDSGEDNSLECVPVFQPLLGRPVNRICRRSSGEGGDLETVGSRRRNLRREARAEVVRRLTETLLLLSIGGVVSLPENSRKLAWEWRKGMSQLPSWTGISLFLAR